jgi:hypothetical protein
VRGVRRPRRRARRRAGARDPAWRRFDVAAIPAAFLVDRERRIVAQWTGEVDVRAIEAEVLRRLPAD